MIAYAAVHRVGSRDLLREFHDSAIASHIRDAADGGIACIGFLYADDMAGIANVSQIIITEILTELIARDYAYAVYHPVDPAGCEQPVIDALRRQGFVNIAPPEETPIYAVNMKSPIVIFRDVETTIKNPFNKNPRVRRAIYEAHNNLLSVMNHIYPGQLILSFNMSAFYNKIIKKVAEINGVSIVEDKKKRRGPYMTVPFGKALSDVLVPNTVTKGLHIDKYFDRTVKSFTIAECQHYSSVDNQVKTIKSFDRPVILIDDLLHKGHRMRMLTPYLEQNGVEIKEVLVGVMTGQAMDMMEEKDIRAESAYFLPSLEVWLNERDCYPFIGGDSLDNAHNYSGYGRNPSINLVLPYVKPAFIGKGNSDADYLYSLTCLQNAASIMETLQDVYQETFEKRLTLKRLGEVITYPRIPDIDVGVKFDENMDPTRFIKNDIERLIRLRWGKEMENLNKWIHDLPGEIGASAMPLDRAPQLAGKARVHIVALGDVGTTMLIGLLLAGQDVIGSVGMCDINEKNLARLEMEMNQIRYPFAGLDGCDDPVLPAVTIVPEKTSSTAMSSFSVPARAYRLSAPAATCAWPSSKPTAVSSPIMRPWPARPASAARSASYRIRSTPCAAPF